MNDWIAIAEEVAKNLEADAVERDLANRPPVQEIDLLRDAGLLTACLPREYGGGGESAWHSIVRRIAAADGSVGHLIGYHYLHLWRCGLFDNPAVADRLLQDTVAHRWFWSGVSNPLEDALVLTPTSSGYQVDGAKSFATGASVADRLVVSAEHRHNGEKITFVVDARAAGVRCRDDWDNMGQRLTASGGVVFQRVAVDPADLLGAQPADPADPATIRLSLSSLGFQLVLSMVCLGIADGSLRSAAQYIRSRNRPWPLSGVDRATDDPYISAGYGELVAMLKAAELLAEDAATALDQATQRGRALTAQQRATTAVTVSSAKVVAARVANETTSRILEFLGARATAAEFGFDRFWRNVRTLTLHDPASYKAREVGAYFLTGERPTFTGYS